MAGNRDSALRLLGCTPPKEPAMQLQPTAKETTTPLLEEKTKVAQTIRGGTDVNSSSSCRSPSNRLLAKFFFKKKRGEIFACNCGTYLPKRIRPNSRCLLLRIAIAATSSSKPGGDRRLVVVKPTFPMMMNGGDSSVGGGNIINTIARSQPSKR